jgi:hypothetical protein
MAREAEHMLGGEAPLAGVPLVFVDDGTQGAQDLMTTDGDQAGELMRTIFVAGLHALAREHKG